MARKERCDRFGSVCVFVCITIATIRQFSVFIWDFLSACVFSRTPGCSSSPVRFCVSPSSPLGSGRRPHCHCTSAEVCRIDGIVVQLSVIVSRGRKKKKKKPDTTTYRFCKMMQPELLQTPRLRVILSNYLAMF